MVDETIQGSGPSAEVQEILKELEAEGKGIAEGAEPKTVEQPKKAEPAKVEEPKPKKAEAEPTEEPEKPEPAPARTSKYVPVTKYNEERHKRQDAEAKAEQAAKEAAELRTRLTQPQAKAQGEQMDDIREAATKIAEKHGLDGEFLSEFAEQIVNIAGKRNVLPKDIETKLAAFEEANKVAEAARFEAAQETGFSTEFEQVIKEFPDMKDRKEELKQLAFSEGNVNTSLRRLAIEFLHDNHTVPGKKTAESPRPGTRSSVNDVIDFAEMDEEQFKKLSHSQMDDYEKWLEKNKNRR